MSVSSHHTVVLRAQDRYWYDVVIVKSFHDPWLDGLHDIIKNRQILFCYDSNLPDTPLNGMIENVSAYADRNPVTYELDGGEGAKSFQSVSRILEVMEREDIRRDALIMAVGGGSIGDAVGFAASIWNRGVSWCVIPTTLLSQTDSAIGGKVGVNLRGIKNRIGSLHQPRGVICVLEWLDSLPEDEYRSGIGEVVKYGLGMDPYVWELLRDNSKGVLCRERHLLHRLVHRCIVLKSRYISLDEHDRGMRHILNLGHTFGHALETACPLLRHGDAVALGLLAATRLSITLKAATPELEDAVIDMLRVYGFKTSIDQELSQSAVQVILADKKHLTDSFTVVLPTSLGRAEIRRGIPFKTIRSCLESLFIN